MRHDGIAELVLSESAPDKVADAAERLAGNTIIEIEASLPGALAGERIRVREYVGAYQALTSQVLDAVSTARTDLILVDEAHQGTIVVEPKSAGSDRPQPAAISWINAALAQEAMSAPFSEWVGALGAGRGTAVAMVAHLRSMLPGTGFLLPPRKRRIRTWDLDERHVVGFYRAVLDELSRVTAPLDQIASVLGLTQTELAGLFGVRRQAIEQWQERGIPLERQEKLATIGEIADLLAAKLKRDRISGVVRRAAPAYGDRTILQAISDNDEDQVFAELRDAFDWASAA